MRKGIFAFTVFLLTFCSAVPLSAQRLLWDVGKYFGQNDPAVTLDYLLYYQYDGRYFKVNAGSFPRNRVTGHYPAGSGIYNRLEISYRYDFKSFLSLRVSSVHHYDGYAWGWQQLVQLTVDLNNFQFPRRPRR